jgi:4-amino-4-deoxy-L-arabinose transferase-like glycosyltransferase
LARFRAQLGPEIGLFALILLAGLILRAWQLGDIPFGFHTDEGHNALDAWRIASEGWRPAFLERNNGREPLFMYLMAACMSLLGPSIAAARSAGVVAGLAAISAQFLLVGALPLRRPKRVALLSAAFLAFSFWPVAQARYALRANLLPVWVMLMLWAWWRAIEAGDGRAGLGGEAKLPEGSVGRDEGRQLEKVGNSGTRQSPVRAAASLRTSLLPVDLAWAALAGLFIALAVHTHLTGRVLPLVLLVSALWQVWRERGPRPLARWALALAVALLFSLPQIQYFRAQPDMLSYRSDQVSIFNPEVNEGDLPGAILDSGWQLLKMPLVEGDSSWYHNIKHRPVFADLLSKLAFVAGLAVFGLWLLGRSGRRRQSAAVLLLVAFGAALAPSWLSVGAPNYVRLTGIWPLLFLLPALGLDALAVRLESASGRLASASPKAARSASILAQASPQLAGRARFLAPALVFIVPTFVLLDTASDYFRDYAPRQEVYDAFNAAAVERGLALAWDSKPHYVTPALWNQSVIRFLNLEQPPRGVFDPREGIVFPHDVHMPGADGRQVTIRAMARYFFDPVETDAAVAFAARWPQAEREDTHGRLGGPLAEASNLIAFTFYGADIAEIVASVPATDVIQFGRHISLRGLEIGPEPVVPGGSLNLILRWDALARTELDENFFLRLTSAQDGRVIAQFDGPPLGGSYPTNVWQPGERILMPLTLELAADAPAGPAILSHGWYDWRDGQRLAVEGHEDGSVDIGTVEVAKAESDASP